MGKLNDIQNLSISNTNSVANLIYNNQIISNNIADSNITQYNSNIIHVTESDWVNFTLYRYADGSGDISRQRIGFNTVFEQFPENLIPYISSNIIINQVDNLPSIPVPDGFSSFYFHPEDNNFFNTISDGFVGTRYGDRTEITGSNIFHIEDIVNSNLKKVTVTTVTQFLISSLVEDEEIPQFQGKLILTITNPNNFSRIT